MSREAIFSKTGGSKMHLTTTTEKKKELPRNPTPDIRECRGIIVIVVTFTETT
jgi:hypothetical protein